MYDTIGDDTYVEENPYIEEFAERLTFLRIQKGVSAREMSLDLGMSHGLINGIESKRSFPRMINFFDICDYLGITPKEFFEYTYKTAIQENGLFREIQKLDEESRDYVLKLVKDLNNRPK